MKQEMKRALKKKDVAKSSSAKAKAMNCNIPGLHLAGYFWRKLFPMFLFPHVLSVSTVYFLVGEWKCHEKYFKKSATTQFVLTSNCNRALLFKYTSQHALALILW